MSVLFFILKANIYFQKDFTTLFETIWDIFSFSHIIRVSRQYLFPIIPTPMKTSSHTPVRADLHFHSTLSDGRKTSAEIIAIAKKRKIELLVNTDHDIVNTETTRLARAAGIRSFEWVEISAHEPISDKHLHITCYAEHFSDRVHSIMTHSRKGRQGKIIRQIGQLCKNGFEIDKDSFFQRFKSQGVNIDNLSNSHLTEYIFLNSKNIAHIERLTGKKLEYGEFLRECLKKEGKYAWIGGIEVPNYDTSIELCSELARENNALLSIAHPNFTFEKDMDRLDAIVAPYVEAGVRGIEINTTASREWVETIIRVKKRHNLILTFGSDCHFKSSADGKHNELGSRNPHLSDAQFESMVKSFIETVEE